MEIVELSTICDRLKSESFNKMGNREKLLNKRLDDINVVRQAYHGNFFCWKSL